VVAAALIAVGSYHVSIVFAKGFSYSMLPGLRSLGIVYSSNEGLMVLTAFTALLSTILVGKAFSLFTPKQMTYEEVRGKMFLTSIAGKMASACNPRNAYALLKYFVTIIALALIPELGLFTPIALSIGVGSWFLSRKRINGFSAFMIGYFLSAIFIKGAQASSIYFKGLEGLAKAFDMWVKNILG